MEHIYRQTEYNVDLLIEESNYTGDLKTIISDLPLIALCCIINSVRFPHDF